MAENGIGAFSSVDLITAAHHYEQCSDSLAAGAACFGWCLQTGRGIPVDFTVAAEFFTKSADLDDPDGTNCFGCCLEHGRGVDTDIERAVRYYRKAALLSHADGMYNFGRCCEYGKGIDRNLHRAAKYYRLSAELKNAAAENSFGICLERGIGVHKNVGLAAQYYLRAAKQCHPDGANNFGFCLEYGRGVQQNIEMAAQFYKFAADRGHSEAKFNHRRCLRLLGRWEPSDRSSDAVSHPPSVDRLTHIFRDFLQKPEPLDNDCRRLLNSFERLKAKTEVLVGLTSSQVKWIPNEIGRGETSAVTLSSDSNGVLSAVKTLFSPERAVLIRRETAILKTLKHPLILNISDSQNNSSIVAEFAGNGSLANHLPPAECPLRGANRITKVIVGIALAMRFVHSRHLIHRDLKPDNILLDWDWTVKIADFGQSSAPDNPDIPPLPHFNPNPEWPSLDFRYLAPECYENHFLPASDVFSFGLIV
jgi:TPR repeat protein